MSNQLAADSVRAVIGRRYGPYHAWHPVNEPMIWQWVRAFGDQNPLYCDAGFASSAGYRNIISPPAMIQGWCLPDISRRYPPQSAAERPYEVLDILAGHGFSGNVAVAYDQQFLRPVEVDEMLHYYVEPVEVSDKKSTRLGTGHFITCLERYINQNEDVVYESRTTYFQFKGGAESQQADQTAERDKSYDAHCNPPEAYDNEVEWYDKRSDIVTGAGIGELRVPITSSRIVVCALASRDWMPVHHSREAAIAQGQRDIFMNILTTGGFVSRFLTDWAGPGSTVRSVKFSLGVPNYPGDQMILTGAVADVTDDGKHVAVEYQGRNQLGLHVSGSAEVALR